jgi:hypothetical protein
MIESERRKELADLLRDMKDDDYALMWEVGSELAGDLMSSDDYDEFWRKPYDRE